MIKKWNVVAAFFESSDARWLDDFIADPDLSFTKIPQSVAGKDWHHTKSRRTNSRQWFRTLQQGWQAFDGRPYGIITCFPQLAMVVALMKLFMLRSTRLVAHNFNIGELRGGLPFWLPEVSISLSCTPRAR